MYREVLTPAGVGVLSLDPTLKNLAQELIELLKKSVGLEKFSLAFAAVQKEASKRRASRKRHRAMQVRIVITNLLQHKIHINTSECRYNISITPHEAKSMQMRTVITSVLQHRIEE